MSKRKLMQLYGDNDWIQELRRIVPQQKNKCICGYSRSTTMHIIQCISCWEHLAHKGWQERYKQYQPPSNPAAQAIISKLKPSAGAHVEDIPVTASNTQLDSSILPPLHMQPPPGQPQEQPIVSPINTHTLQPQQQDPLTYVNEMDVQDGQYHEQHAVFWCDSDVNDDRQQEESHDTDGSDSSDTNSNQLPVLKEVGEGVYVSAATHDAVAADPFPSMAELQVASLEETSNENHQENIQGSIQDTVRPDENPKTVAGLQRVLHLPVYRNAEQLQALFPEWDIPTVASMCAQLMLSKIVHRRTQSDIQSQIALMLEGGLLPDKSLFPRSWYMISRLIGCIEPDAYKWHVCPQCDCTFKPVSKRHCTHDFNKVLRHTGVLPGSQAYVDLRAKYFCRQCGYQRFKQQTDQHTGKSSTVCECKPYWSIGVPIAVSHLFHDVRVQQGFNKQLTMHPYFNSPAYKLLHAWCAKQVMQSQQLTTEEAIHYVQNNVIFIDLCFDGFKPFNTRTTSTNGTMIRIKNVGVSVYNKQCNMLTFMVQNENPVGVHIEHTFPDVFKSLQYYMPGRNVTSMQGENYHIVLSGIFCDMVARIKAARALGQTATQGCQYCVISGEVLDIVHRTKQFKGEQYDVALEQLTQEQRRTLVKFKQMRYRGYYKPLSVFKSTFTQSAVIQEGHLPDPPEVIALKTNKATKAIFGMVDTTQPLYCGDHRLTITQHMHELRQFVVDKCNKQYQQMVNLHSEGRCSKKQLAQADKIAKYAIKHTGCHGLDLMTTYLPYSMLPGFSQHLDLYPLPAWHMLLRGVLDDLLRLIFRSDPVHVHLVYKDIPASEQLGSGMGMKGNLGIILGREKNCLGTHELGNTPKQLQQYGDWTMDELLKWAQTYYMAQLYNVSFGHPLYYSEQQRASVTEAIFKCMAAISFFCRPCLVQGDQYITLLGFHYQNLYDYASTMEQIVGPALLKANLHQAICRLKQQCLQRGHIGNETEVGIERAIQELKQAISGGRVLSKHAEINMLNVPLARGLLLKFVGDNNLDAQQLLHSQQHMRRGIGLVDDVPWYQKKHAEGTLLQKWGGPQRDMYIAEQAVHVDKRVPFFFYGHVGNIQREQYIGVYTHCFRVDVDLVFSLHSNAFTAEKLLDASHMIFWQSMVLHDKYKIDARDFCSQSSGENCWVGVRYTEDADMRVDVCRVHQFMSVACKKSFDLFDKQLPRFALVEWFETIPVPNDYFSLDHTTGDGSVNIANTNHVHWHYVEPGNPRQYKTIINVGQIVCKYMRCKCVQPAPNHLEVYLKRVRHFKARRDRWLRQQRQGGDGRIVYDIFVSSDGLIRAVQPTDDTMLEL